MSTASKNTLVALLKEGITQARAPLQPDGTERVIQEFLALSRSQATRKTYELAIMEFVDGLRTSGLPVVRLSEVKPEHIAFWQRALQQHHRPTTVATKLSALCSLFHHAYERGFLESNPARFVKRPNTSRFRGVFEPLSSDEVRTILVGLRTEAGKSLGCRQEKQRAWLEYVLFATAICLGLRAQELANLKVRDLDLSGKWPRLFIRSKGDHLHRPIIPEELASLLKFYLTEIRKHPKPDASLFYNCHCKEQAYLPISISRMITRIGKRFGIERKITVHTLRTTVACLLHETQVPIGEIQELLGHRDVRMTAKYLRISEEPHQAASRKLGFLFILEKRCA